MYTLTDSFDCIYVINLPDRKDRFRAIRTELARCSMSFTDAQVRLFSATRYHEACGFPSPSVRGCFLSHLSILKEARERGLRNVLVMEDDLAISPLLLEHLPAIMEKVKRRPWGFLYFGHIEPLQPSQTPSMVSFSGPLVTAHFYAVNSIILDRLIRYLEEVQTRPVGHPEGGPMHFDGALSMFRRSNPDILTLIAQPAMGWQRSSRSDIHAQWFDRLPGLRQAASVARSVRRYLADRNAILPDPVASSSSSANESQSSPMHSHEEAPTVGVH